MLTLLDSFLTSLARPRQPSRGDYLRIVFDPKIRHFDRPAAALSFVDALLPGTARWWGKLVLRADRLPIRCSSLEPLAHGSGTTVYSYENPRGHFVCKAQRKSLGLPLRELMAFAADRSRRYRGALRQYEAAAEVFPPAHFVIGHGPLLSVPVVMTLQPFVAGPTRDLLHDVDEDELARLVEDPRLGDAIKRFFECTIEAWESGPGIADLGRDNLVLVGTAGEERLVYLDAEMLEVATLKASGRRRYYEGIIGRMRECLSRFSAGVERDHESSARASLRSAHPPA